MFVLYVLIFKSGLKPAFVIKSNSFLIVDVKEKVIVSYCSLYTSSSASCLIIIAADQKYARRVTMDRTCVCDMITDDAIVLLCSLSKYHLPEVNQRNRGWLICKVGGSWNVFYDTYLLHKAIVFIQDKCTLR